MKKEGDSINDSELPSPPTETFHLSTSPQNNSSSSSTSPAFTDFYTTTTSTNIQESTSSSTTEMDHHRRINNANRPVRTLLPKSGSETFQGSPMATENTERVVHGQNLVSEASAPIGLGITFPLDQPNTRPQGFNQVQLPKKPFAFDPSRPEFVPSNPPFQFAVPEVPQAIGRNAENMATSKLAASPQMMQHSFNYNSFQSPLSAGASGPTNIETNIQTRNFGPQANGRQQINIRENDNHYRQEAAQIQRNDNAAIVPLDGHHPISAAPRGHQEHWMDAFSKAVAGPELDASMERHNVPVHAQGTGIPANASQAAVYHEGERPQKIRKTGANGNTYITNSPQVPLGNLAPQPAPSSVSEPTVTAPVAQPAGPQKSREILVPKVPSRRIPALRGPAQIVASGAPMATQHANGSQVQGQQPHHTGGYIQYENGFSRTNSIESQNTPAGSRDRGRRALAATPGLNISMHPPTISGTQFREANPYAYRLSYFANSYESASKSVEAQIAEYEAIKAERNRIHNEYWLEKNTEVGCLCGCQTPMQNPASQLANASGLDASQAAVREELEIVNASFGGVIGTWGQPGFENTSFNNNDFDEGEDLQDDILNMEN